MSSSSAAGARRTGGLEGVTFWSGPQQFRVEAVPKPGACGYVMAERVGGGYAVPFAVDLVLRLAGAGRAEAGGAVMQKA
jgi:hypothetical protein